MTVEMFFTFVAVCIVLAMTPGPAMSLIIANSTTHGTRAGLSTVAGNTMGLILLVAGATLGMSSVMAVMATWFDWLRWIGAIYLVWLGIARIRAGLKGTNLSPETGGRKREWFRQGFLVALSNPKALLFLGAFFPQFITPSEALLPQLSTLALTFVLVLTTIDAAYAFFAGKLRLWFLSRHRSITDYISGTLLIIGGFWLAIAKR